MTTTSCTDAVFRGVGRVNRIDVLSTDQIVAVIADIVHFPRKRIGERALNSQRPSHHPGRNDVPGDGCDIAWAWVRNSTDLKSIAA